MAALILRSGREKSLLRRHPWIYSGAVARMEGDAAAGEVVAVRDAGGNFLAWAAYSQKSQICGRVWSWQEAETIDRQFLARRLAGAFARRASLLGEQRALRLVHAESDGIPGLILDRYEDTLVAQFLSAGAEYWRETLADLAMEVSGAARLFERSDVDVRELEGLPLRVANIRGSEPPAKITITENELKFNVDVRHGHKTGFYLDQRRNRQIVRSLASGREVLDCFCYTGGFTVNALAGGAASVVSVDASGDALSMLRENVALNRLPSERNEQIGGDVFQVLRQFRDRRRSFDLVVLDPPKFAQTTTQVERAARGYKDINLLAFKLLRPGGILVTFSCSGGVSADLFQKIVAGAALDAGVEAQIVEYLHPGADHPVALNFPEGAYLKGLVLAIN